MNTVILEPTAHIGAVARTAWRPVDTLQGKVVGFIDTKPKFHLLADDLAKLLVERHGAAGVVRHRKLSALDPGAGGRSRRRHAKCELVITDREPLRRLTSRPAIEVHGSVEAAINFGGSRGS